MTDIQVLLDSYVNKPVEAEDPSNKFQCFDWAFKYCDEIGVPRDAIRHLYAYEIFTKPNDQTIQYFDYIPNTPTGTPLLGDIVVFGTGVGPAGHVSVCQSATTSTIRSLDQNWNGHSYCEYINHPYDNVLGWLRPLILNPDIQDQLRKERDANWVLYQAEITENERLKKSILDMSDKITQEQSINTDLQNQLNGLNDQIRQLQGQLSSAQAAPQPDSYKDLTDKYTHLQNLVQSINTIIYGNGWPWTRNNKIKNVLSEAGFPKANA